MICDHSFSKELMGHNNFHSDFNNYEEMNFQENKTKPQVYEP